MVLLGNKSLFVYCLLLSAVAQTVLEKPDLNLEGGLLDVSRAWDKARRQEESDRQDKSRRQEKSDRKDKSRRQEESDSQDKSHRLEESPEPEGSSQEEWDGRCIEVCGFNPSATGDAIVLSFESKFPSGDGTVQSVQRSPDKNVTYLTFETVEG